MMKLAYAIGVRRAYEQLGFKVAALPTAGVSQSSGRTSATPGKPFYWGLGGTPPGQGWTTQDPASIQAGAQPGGPPQLDAAPRATPPTAPGASPPSAQPLRNEPITQPSATGITPPLEASQVPGGGSPLAASKGRAGTDVKDVAAQTSGAPTR